MFRVHLGNTRRYCDGASRRSFLQVGVAGMGAASLGRVLEARDSSTRAGLPQRDTSVLA